MSQAHGADGRSSRTPPSTCVLNLVTQVPKFLQKTVSWYPLRYCPRTVCTHRSKERRDSFLSASGSSSNKSHSLTSCNGTLTRPYLSLVYFSFVSTSVFLLYQCSRVRAEGGLVLDLFCSPFLCAVTERENHANRCCSLSLIFRGRTHPN